MKNVFAVLLIFSGICCLGGGLDRELNRVERWQDNASGVTKRTFDASEKAMWIAGRIRPSKPRPANLWKI